MQTLLTLLIVLGAVVYLARLWGGPKRKLATFDPRPFTNAPAAITPVKRNTCGTCGTCGACPKH